MRQMRCRSGDVKSSRKKMKRLREFARRIVHFTPFGLGRCGRESYIFRPRRIEGAENIELGDRTIINKHSWLCTIEGYANEQFQPRLVFGNDVYVGQYACIVATQNLTIGDGCVLSEHVYVTDNGHGLSPDAGLIMQQPLFRKGAVRLGSHCFLGYRACILPGVQLGEHCVVGANSVVTKSFPAYSMVAGVPAQLIKQFSRQANQWISVGDSIEKHSRQH